MNGTAFQSVGTFARLPNESFGLLNVALAIYSVLAIIDSPFVRSYALNLSVLDNYFRCIVCCYFV